MKKIVSLLLLATFSLPIMAQEAKPEKAAASSNASEYLPQAGNIAIGFSANPFVNYLGNFFNGATTNNYAFDEVGGQPLFTNKLGAGVQYPVVSITGKYMMTDKKAIRMNAGLILERDNAAFFVQDDKEAALNPLSEAKVTDNIVSKLNGGTIAVGLEKRMGSGRLQGIIAGSLAYAFQSDKYTFTYGNAITSINQAPSVNTNVTYAAHGQLANSRPTSRYNDGTHSTGIVGAVGMEYFLAPQISFGAEVNISLLYTWTGNTYVTREGFNTLTNQVEEHTDLISPSSSNLKFGTENFGANMFFNFYFDK